MGSISTALAARLEEMQRRHEESANRTDQLIRETQEIISKADQFQISEEEMIADAILLLREHGYKVIKSEA